jgi:hypothetical protein
MARVVAIVDPRNAAASELARQVGAEVCLLERALAIADAVVIAAPTGAHAALVAQALHAGRHVLVEKPLCIAAAEAHALCATAGARGVVLAVGHSERFNPAIRALADLRLTLTHVATRRLSASAAQPLSGGLLLNLGVHDLDLAAYLARHTATLLSAWGHADHAELTASAGPCASSLELAQGAPARIRTLQARTAAGGLYEVNLARATLERVDGKLTSRLPTPEGEPLAAQAEAFLDAIHGRPSAALATGLDGARAVALAEQAQACIDASPQSCPSMRTFDTR